MMDRAKESKNEQRAAGEIKGTKQIREGIQITNFVTNNGTKITYVSRTPKTKK